MKENTNFFIQVLLVVEKCQSCHNNLLHRILPNVKEKIQSDNNIMNMLI